MWRKIDKACELRSRRGRGGNSYHPFFSGEISFFSNSFPILCHLKRELRVLWGCRSPYSAINHKAQAIWAAKELYLGSTTGYICAHTSATVWDIFAVLFPRKSSPRDPRTNSSLNALAERDAVGLKGLTEKNSCSQMTGRDLWGQLFQTLHLQMWS